jgi:ABC-type sugar transport system ATPase subunit
MLEPADSTITSKQPLLSLRGVEKRYGSIVALHDVDFDIWPNEIHALVGDNGAGKSTLVKIIAGAHSADRGSITVEGVEREIGTPQASTALGIATVYQNLALVDCRTVAQNVFLGREPTRWRMVDRKRLRDEAAAAVGSLGVANLSSVEIDVENLSGGQRQAVAIARAVQEGNRMLVLDEPTAALGVRESQRVLELIDRLRGRGITVMLVSHNLQHVFRVADRISVMRSGTIGGTRLISDTTPDEIVGLITGTIED